MIAADDDFVWQIPHQPAATHLDARGEHAALRRMYLTGSRLMLLLTAVCGIVAALWAEDFFRLWVGPQFLTSATYPSVALLFWILLGANVVAVGFSCW